MSSDDHFEEGEEAPPAGVRSMAIVRWVLLGAMALAAAASVYAYTAPLLGDTTVKPAAKFHCPMHPQIVSDQPGECPICHMKLEPIPEKDQAAPSPAPVASAPEKQPPPGTAPVKLELDRIQAIGVRTARVEARASDEALRMTASVAAPDEALAAVHFRAEGFVEGIAVKELGVEVKRGQHLASIYSPEIYQAQQELLAIGAWGASKGALASAAYRRLELLGLGKPAIDKIIERKEAIRAVGVSAPIAGYVIKKNVVLGSRVTPETVLFEIADLERVYIVASAYPHQLASIHVGQKARFETSALAGRKFEAQVDLIYPDVDVTTRTARVRFKIDNKDKALRPGMFGNAAIEGAATKDLTVPLDAIVDTGRSTYVFVALGSGRFEPRVIEVGEEIGDRVVVRGPITQADEVVSGATFLIDAESRLQASLAAPATSGAPIAGSCEAEFDRQKYAVKFAECKKCEAHRGMGSMEQDCRNAIPKPWR